MRAIISAVGFLSMPRRKSLAPLGVKISRTEYTEIRCPPAVAAAAAAIAATPESPGMHPAPAITGIGGLRFMVSRFSPTSTSGRLNLVAVFSTQSEVSQEGPEQLITTSVSATKSSMAS